MHIAALAAALSAAPVVAHAQMYVLPPDPARAKDGCTGFSYDVRLSHLTRTASGMIITGIDSLAPSARAGLMVGDSIIAINGVPIGDRSIGLHWRVPPGTAHVLTARRDGKTIEVKFNAGVRDTTNTDAEKATACRPFRIVKP